jgi:uncharacterized membrane protein
MQATVEDVSSPTVPGPGELSQKTRKPEKAGWLVAAGLILVSAVPLADGAFRLTELAVGAEITPGNAKFLASPVPIVLHLVSASVYSVLGAFQFAAGFRRRRPGWHRAAGRLLIPLGLLAALTGLWMTLFYPRPAGSGDLLVVFRLLFGSAMVASIVLGFSAIRRGDVRGHRAWMARAYAIGLGTGTQVLHHVFWLVLVGPSSELGGALQMAGSWLINLAVAEWAIRKQPSHPARSAGMRPSRRRSASLSAGNP